MQQEIITKAVEKLNFEHKKCKGLSQKGNAVKEYVFEALTTFCQQNEEFSQAVFNKQESLKECIEQTVKSCGSSISDIDVYKKAVSFYFLGATVHFEMKIDLGDGGYSNLKPEGKSLTVSLDELFD